MQLGSRVGCQLGSCRRRLTCQFARRSLAAPPVNLATQPQQRSLVLTRAKRGSKRSNKGDQSESDAEEAATGWDAALANIPTEDEAQEEPTTIPEAGEAEQNAMDAAVTAERAADQASEPSKPSTSYGGSDPPPAPAAAAAKKERSTIISLAEYTMLMEAKAQREREIAEQKEREARAAAGLLVQEAAPLDISRQGFQAFALDGGELELLVSETVDGRLVLGDSYVATKAAGGAEGQQSFSRPKGEEVVPKEALAFQVIPWVERGASDTFKRKEATNKVKKIYFLSLGPVVVPEGVNPEFDLDNVFVFDGGSRAFSRSDVRVVGTLPMFEPVLRIRPSGITLEESFLLPDPIKISSETAGQELADLSEEELQERLDELGGEEMDELDEMPDVPSVDMM